MAPLHCPGPIGKAPADPIQHHGDQGDHNASQQALAKLSFAHSAQDFPADIGRTANDRGNDHHT